MPKAKRPSKPPAATSKRSPRRTAIVPRIVFQTAVAVAVVPLAGCPTSSGTDAGRDTPFSVADSPMGRDVPFSVADVGFSVAIRLDAPFSVADIGFSVAVPLDVPADDAGMFSVAIEPPDTGA